LARKRNFRNKPMFPKIVFSHTFPPGLWFGLFGKGGPICGRAKLIAQRCKTWEFQGFQCENRGPVVTFDTLMAEGVFFKVWERNTKRKENPLRKESNHGRETHLL